MDTINSEIPPQSQKAPGLQAKMRPQPQEIPPDYRGSAKLEGKVALITGGDSGIGRSVAILFAKEGADLAIVYLEETEDAAKTKRDVEREGRRCLLIKGDIGDPRFCHECVEKTVKKLGRLDVLVNNAAEQHETENFEEIDPAQIRRTFETNVFGMFYLTKEALRHMPEEGAIINSTSVTAYRGSDHLVDYAATKGAIVSFTRSLAKMLAGRKIRVNAVAPGPIWTPLIPASFKPEEVAKFGRDTLMGRPGHPSEVAPSYVFLASQDASYMTGQVLHPNGGEIVNT